jgi:hypothetical protein
MLLDPRLSIVLVFGFALLFWAVYHITLSKDQEIGHRRAGGAADTIEYLG